MEFISENALTQVVYQNPYIDELVESSDYLTRSYLELKGLFGIPDLVVLNYDNRSEKINIIKSYAFEMKIKNWQRALIQAYKYLAFSNYSYVVLDHKFTNSAISNLCKFQNANVGLISVDVQGNFYTHFVPIFSEPYSDDLVIKFHKLIYSNILNSDNSD